MRAAKVDRNHAEIADGLREVPGVSVQSLAMVGNGMPADLLIGYRGLDFKLSIKHPDRKSKRNAPAEKRQREWEANWKGQPTIEVTTLAEALRAIGAEE